MARSVTVPVKVTGLWKVAAVGVLFTVLNLGLWLGLIAGALLLVRAIFGL